MSQLLSGQAVGRETAVTGILANGLGLAYCPALVFAPAIIWLPPTLSAPLRLVWYVLIARTLFKLGKAEK